MSHAAPVLSLCMIVRDSARTLPACLASIRPWVDEIIVVDTGSLDDSRDIAKGFGAELHEFPWIDDFAAARNESLRHAHGKWLFWMDSDDTISAEIGHGLQKLAQGTHDPQIFGYVVQVHCPGPSSEETTVVDHVKLIRNDEQIRFEGRIHEQVLPSIRRLNGEVAWTDLFVTHSGAEQSPEGKQRKCERDLRILELDLQERLEHPFVLFNLGMTYEDMGKYETAEKWLRRCLAASNPGESHVRKAYALLASCLGRLHRWLEAKQTCERGLALFPNDLELRFRLGIAAHSLGDLQIALATYRSILRVQEIRHFSSIDPTIGGTKTRHNLALVHSDLGEFQLAELQWRLVLQESVNCRPAWVGLGQALLDQDKLATAEVLADELETNPRTYSDSLWLRSELNSRSGNPVRSRALLETATSADPDNLVARRALCHWLFKHGTLTDAEEALLDLVLRAPGDASAYHNLGVVYARQERDNDAKSSLQHSLKIRPNWPPTLSELARLSTAQGNLRASASWPDNPVTEYGVNGNGS